MTSSAERESGKVITPTPELKPFEKLIGTWTLRGRTLDSQEDNITGMTTIEWLLGGHFLKLTGEMDFCGFQMQSLEIIAYDPYTKTFPATVYSSMSGDVLSYEWNIQDDTIIHSGLGAIYRGVFSADGRQLIGGWRPDEGTEAVEGSAYDAVMTRME